MRDDINLYVNFALHAVFGKLGAADTIMRFAGDAVRRVADEIAAECPIDPTPLHRGMLLDPALPFRVRSRPDVSLVERRSRRRAVVRVSTIRRQRAAHADKSDAARLRRNAAGPAITRAVHHSWASALGGLACFALVHPLMGAEGKRQIEWSLRTQREIITDPVADLLPEPVADLDSAALEALERRLSPAWVIAEEGLRR